MIYPYSFIRNDVTWGLDSVIWKNECFVFLYDVTFLLACSTHNIQVTQRS